MTSYSVLPSGSKASVIATWTSEFSDHSAKVTTLADAEPAAELAYLLTRLSEHAWSAAAWSGISPVIEAGIARLVERLRSTEPRIAPVDLVKTDHRHTEGYLHSDVTRLLTSQLPDLLGDLTGAQRHSIADELVLDADARAEALRLLVTGWDPESTTSRIWQMCEVTRSMSFGESGPLPEGGAGWINRVWETQGSPAGRWGARDRLMRLEQLVEACKAHGGRAEVEENPTHAHLVVPRTPDSPLDDVDIFDVRVHDRRWDTEDADPFAPLVITRRLPGGSEVLGEVEPDDDDAFAKLLGEWTRLLPSPVVIDRSRE
ncbi:hypothetical protein [Saccharothrix australiensis]|uniref:Uncharacterized protein n=1 Tax=Saccharothrix australiensis TaxID=2072 RepID=A0A495W1I7_9PSEU|nr:hypothetical protein [Saccharothrix australiensis]RKT55551.1 hypothetical protein C8E97_4222 [Saccharothrix australiensis]